MAKRSFFGTLMCAAVGAAIAVFFTPVNGMEARKRVKDRYNGIKDKLMEYLRCGAEAALQYTEKTTETVKEKAESIRETTEQAKEKASTMESEMAGRKGGSSEKAKQK